MEKVKLEIEGLPQLVYAGRTYQYRIIVRNHESHSVTALLRNHQNRHTSRLTIPAGGSTNVDVRGEFEIPGSQYVTYTLLKSGYVLDSTSQRVEVEAPPGEAGRPEDIEIRAESESTRKQIATYPLMNNGKTPGPKAQVPEVSPPPAEAERPKSESRSETRIALLVLLVFAIAISSPVWWPKLSGVLTGRTSGTYGDYYLGIVIEKGALQVDSYGDPIVLINDKNARNPTYSQLLDFLRSDNTDLYPFQSTATIPPPRSGNPENYVDLQYWKEIIDATVQPEPPRICADYAQRLHNNAEMAGIRCALVSVALDGPTYNHMLNAFETTDRGLIYIDDSGTDGSHNVDKAVDVEIGESYVPQSLFPTSGWSSTWQNSGTVNDVFITWDGQWNK